MKMENFLIVASPRSGSTYLCNLLNTQKEVRCYSEIFHPDEVPLKLRDWSRLGVRYTTQYRDKHPEKFVRDIFNKKRLSLSQKKIIGAKLLIHHHQIEYGLEPLFSKINKIIFLERRNKLAWYASFKLALETGDWFNHPGKKYDNKINFDENLYFDYLKNEAEYFNRVFSRLSLAKHRYIHLFYEDIKSLETMNKISDFLSLPPITVPELNAWSKPRDFLSSFSNPEAVRAFADKHSLTGWIA